MTRPLVEILYFERCPNRDAAVSLVEGVSSELGVEPEIRVVTVADVDDAVRKRFLGSPTVRVNGVDVEPGADARADFVMGCRVYRTATGYAGTPDATWVRSLLGAAAHRA